MEKELKMLGLTRYNDVGKRIGNHVWVHIRYMSDYAFNHADIEIRKLLDADNSGFNPNIVRIDLSNKDEILLIEVDDFDINDEPAIIRTEKFKPGTSFFLNKDRREVNNADHFTVDNDYIQSKNPLIYHHKWMMVKDDYDKFDIKHAKQRSIAWKQHLGVDRSVSSRIGRKLFWEKWLSDELPWLLESGQEFTSKNTSINQNKLPKGFTSSIKKGLLVDGMKNLDLGGGRFDNATEALKEKGITNLVYDPFNRTPDHNTAVMKEANQGVDSVSIHNVLNVIKEKSARILLLKVAFRCLKEGGILIVTIYEGVGENLKSSKGKKTGKDKWQNHLPKEDYIPEISEIFSQVKIENGLIIAIK